MCIPDLKLYNRAVEIKIDLSHKGNVDKWKTIKDLNISACNTIIL